MNCQDIFGDTWRRRHDSIKQHIVSEALLQVYIRIVKSTAYSPTFSLQSCSKKGENFSGVELDLVLYQISSSF